MAYDDDQPHYQSQLNAYENTSNQIRPSDPEMPITSTEAKSGIFASNSAIKEGWTFKKGPGKLSKWRKRYIQLSNNKQLCYFTDASMIVKKGTIFLSGLDIHSIKRSSKSSDSKHHGFCVITPNRTYQFCVASASDRDHWIQKIREMIDQSWKDLNLKKGKSPSISYSSKPLNNNNNNNNISPLAVNPQKKYGYDNNIYDTDNESKQNNKQSPVATSQRSQLRSKYKRKPQTQSHNNNNNNNNQNGSRVISEQQAQQQIKHLENKNDELLDQALMTTYETSSIAANTAQQLDSQRHQLLKIDKDLHETNEMLNQTEGILDGMKSFGGMIRKAFKKKKEPLHNSYQSPVTNKSAVERNKQIRRGYDNKNQNQNQNQNQSQLQSQSQSNKVQDAKLDELLKGVKALNQVGMDINQEFEEQDVILDNINQKMDVVAPRMKHQVRTMDKIT